MTPEVAEKIKWPGGSSFSAASGLRSNNPHNHDHRDHTGPASLTIADVGPIPDSYFVNPEEMSEGLTKRFGSDAGTDPRDDDDRLQALLDGQESRTLCARGFW